MSITPQAPPPASQNLLGSDLPTTSRFLLELDGAEIGVFSSVSGLEMTVQTYEIAEGGQNGFSHKLPGRITWPNLVFRRGITDSDALFAWLQKSSGEGYAAAGNKLTRSSGAVTAIGLDGSRLRSWNLIDVWPVRWKGPDFDVSRNDPLQEELEIAHHGFVSAKPARA
jgi:phage tail-like protein